MADNIENPYKPVFQNKTTVNSNIKNSDTPKNNSTAGTNLDPRFVHQIRDQLFYIEIWMYNQLEKFEPFAIPFFFVEGLCIEETIINWVTRGWLVLSNDYEIIERGSLSYKNNETYSEQIDAPFMFRSDGRNKISIKIKPINTSNNNVGEELPKEQWEMQYDFVIYDIEDLPTETAARKLRKFYFWEERYQIFLERNIEWSTAIYAKGNSDIERSLPVGGLQETSNKAENVHGAIESIIRAAASNISDPFSPNIKIGSKEGPKGINNPDFPLDNFDKENWDAGSPDSRVFYTSPANSCVLKDLSYVMGSLKASDGSPLFLTLDRYYRDDGKKWQLIPMSKFFIDATKNQVERLLIEDNQDPTGAPPYQARAPQGEEGTIRNFQSGIASRILTYKFAPMSSNDDLIFTNTPVHTFDFSNGSFNIGFKGNTVKDLLKNMKTMADKGLHSYKNEKQLLMNVNKTKYTGLMTSNNMVSRRFFPNDISYVSMAKEFLFLNQAVNFTAYGLTLRTPGKFIFIDRAVSTLERNPFDDRFLGQWMMIKVVHLFTKDRYINDVVATKIDSYNRWFNEIDKDDPKYY